MDYGYFTKDTTPKTECKIHVLVNYDTINKGIVPYGFGDGYAKVSLVKNENRSFPKEVYITDAEYVYRDTKITNDFETSLGLPYFYNSLDYGEYAGISKKKKQFNSYPENVLE